LNRKPGRHGTDLFEMPVPCRIAYDLSEEWEQVEEPKHDPDRSGGVANGGGGIYVRVWWFQLQLARNAP
jgi:hypothetical protein